MPGAVWFPQARLNYAERLFRGKPDDRVAILHASELPRARRVDLGRAARADGGDPRRARGARGRPGRPRRRLPAEHPRDDRRLPGHRVARRRVVLRRARVRRAQRGRPLRPDRAEGAAGGRRLPLRRQGLRPARRRRRDRRGDRRARSCGSATSTARGWEDGFLGDDAARVRAGAVRPPAVGPLLVGHDRAAEGDRPGPGRDPARAPQDDVPAPRLPRRRPRVLVHHDGLDDVELPRLVLLTDAAIVLYDGNPGTPGLDRLWDLAEEAGITTFGTSASYLASCMKAGVEPAAGRDLSALRAVGSTGSPLAPEGFAWVYEHVGADTWLFSTSGGTDVCTAFVGGCPVLPVYLGELQARALGADLHAFDEDGNAVIDEVGELVLTQPMPSMPVAFWDDEDGAKLREAYFDKYPGVWRHGDWIRITPRGTAVIYGRSDSTINRGGVRMGTSEIYRAVLALDESSTRSWSTCRARARRTGCRCSSCCATARSSTTTSSRRSAGACARTARRATSRARSGRSPRCRARSRARCSRSRSSGSSWARRPSARRAATRSRTPPRWTTSPRSPRSLSAMRERARDAPRRLAGGTACGAAAPRGPPRRAGSPAAARRGAPLGWRLAGAARARRAGARSGAGRGRSRRRWARSASRAARAAARRRRRAAGRARARRGRRARPRARRARRAPSPGARDGASSAAVAAASRRRSGRAAARRAASRRRRATRAAAAAVTASAGDGEPRRARRDRARAAARSRRGGTSVRAREQHGADGRSRSPRPPSRSTRPATPPRRRARTSTTCVAPPRRAAAAAGSSATRGVERDAERRERGDDEARDRRARAPRARRTAHSSAPERERAPRRAAATQCVSTHASWPRGRAGRRAQATAEHAARRSLHARTGQNASIHGPGEARAPRSGASARRDVHYR